MLSTSEWKTNYLTICLDQWKGKVWWRGMIWRTPDIWTTNQLLNKILVVYYHCKSQHETDIQSHLQNGPTHKIRRGEDHFAQHVQSDNQNHNEDQNMFIRFCNSIHTTQVVTPSLTLRHSGEVSKMTSFSTEMCLRRITIDMKSVPQGSKNNYASSYAPFHSTCFACRYYGCTLVAPATAGLWLKS